MPSRRICSSPRAGLFRRTAGPRLTKHPPSTETLHGVVVEGEVGMVGCLGSLVGGRVCGWWCGGGGGRYDHPQSDPTSLAGRTEREDMAEDSDADEAMAGPQPADGPLYRSSVAPPPSQQIPGPPVPEGAGRSPSPTPPGRDQELIFFVVVLGLRVVIGVIVPCGDLFLLFRRLVSLSCPFPGPGLQQAGASSPRPCPPRPVRPPGGRVPAGWWKPGRPSEAISGRPAPILSAWRAHVQPMLRGSWASNGWRLAWCLMCAPPNRRTKHWIPT